MKIVLSSRVVQDYLGGPHPGVGGWVGGLVSSFFKEVFVFVGVFIFFTQCSHSVHNNSREVLQRAQLPQATGTSIGISYVNRCMRGGGVGGCVCGVWV